MCDRFPRITRSIISTPTNLIQCRLNLPIINLVVKILTNSNNLFGNGESIELNYLSSVQIHSRPDQSMTLLFTGHWLFPLESGSWQVDVGRFFKSVLVRRPGCGVLLFPLTLDEFPKFVDKSFFNHFFFVGCQGSVLSVSTRKSRWTWVETSKIILDFYSVNCLVHWITVTFPPWLSLSVILPKTILNLKTWFWWSNQLQSIKVDSEPHAFLRHFRQFVLPRRLKPMWFFTGEQKKTRDKGKKCHVKLWWTEKPIRSRCGAPRTNETR